MFGTRRNGFFGSFSNEVAGYAKLDANNFWTGFNIFSNGLSTTNAQASTISLITTKTIYNGSIGGTATFAMPFNGVAYKKVIVYCSALNGNTALYTFPTAFIDKPAIISTNQLSASLVTTLTLTQMAVTGSGDSGFLILEGF